eukprot:CAMPEP_0194362444 /NCGR_PEP_ID=MMETSP0174-20130528/10184_1 /TAXON_ID=216777 /ORGANISM="Proboscia alata, Strain PI-D3" /LENGTH=408 /DNA_ID=CAMNT_0039135307 /DNA_START=289 /DNA_END=1515 /DNA_ORIENTATION=-
MATLDQGKINTNHDESFQSGSTSAGVDEERKRKRFKKSAKKRKRSRESTVVMNERVKTGSSKRSLSNLLNSTSSPISRCNGSEILAEEKGVQSDKKFDGLREDGKIAAQPNKDSKTENESKSKIGSNENDGSTEQMTSDVVNEIEENKGPKPPEIKQGSVEFSVCSINAHLVCGLCRGYFRDPYTITECLHTFCKSCLFFAFQSGFRRCPTCDKSLEPDPFRCVLSDRSLHELVHKIFPSLQDMDDEYEEEFYKARGIKRKVSLEESNAAILAANESSETKASLHESEKKRKTLALESSSGCGSKKHAIANDDLELLLLPSTDVKKESTMSSLLNPHLRTSGSLKVSQLKKYLVRKLDIATKPSAIELLCNGEQVGDELSLTFIQRTRWFNANSDLCLTFRLDEDGFY